jgi:hypothetical protein
MARGCKCAGNSCSCLVQGAGGIRVSGIGTKDDPYEVEPDHNTFSVSGHVEVIAGANVKVATTGAGTALNPLRFTVSVELTAPNGTKYTLAVNNAGALTAVQV